MRRGFVGQSVTRLEDEPLVTGRGRFAADVNFPHQLHMHVVRSSRAHGKISAIDVTAASAHPGIAAVWTSDDIADIPPIDFREGRIAQFEAYRQPLLATAYVRYVGEPLAAIFAESAYAAEDAAELVHCVIEDLPVILAPDHAPGEFKPGFLTEPTVILKEYGDVSAGFRAAHQILEL